MQDMSKLVLQVTTTADGECTEEFDGTSAACPFASGVMALVLEAK